MDVVGKCWLLKKKLKCKTQFKLWEAERTVGPIKTTGSAAIPFGSNLSSAT